jgi:hypothetical protein
MLGDDGMVMITVDGTAETNETGTTTGELQVDGTVTVGIETVEILITLTVETTGETQVDGWFEITEAGRMLDGISEVGIEVGTSVVTDGAITMVLLVYKV